MPEVPVVLLCRCVQAGLVPEAAVTAVAAAADEQGWTVLVVDDLCHLAASADPLLARCAAAADLRIGACFPRAVQALFAQAGQDPGPALWANLRCGEDGQALLAAPRSGSSAGSPVIGPVAPPPADLPPGWTAWFPVIDRERCTDCDQCRQFCIFGVYDRDDAGRVRVAQPHQCKDRCPACARVCPQLAIIFPRHGERPINGDAVAEGEHGADLQALAGGDVCSLLRQRSAAGGPRPRFARDLPPGEPCPCEDDPLLLLDRLGVPRSVVADLDPSQLRALRPQDPP